MATEQQLNSLLARLARVTEEVQDLHDGPACPACQVIYRKNEVEIPNHPCPVCEGRAERAARAQALHDELIDYVASGRADRRLVQRAIVCLRPGLLRADLRWARDQADQIARDADELSPST